MRTEINKFGLTILETHLDLMACNVPGFSYVVNTAPLILRV